TANGGVLLLQTGQLLAPGLDQGIRVLDLGFEGVLPLASGVERGRGIGALDLQALQLCLRLFAPEGVTVQAFAVEIEALAERMGAVLELALARPSGGKLFLTLLRRGAQGGEALFAGPGLALGDGKSLVALIVGGPRRGYGLLGFGPESGIERLEGGGEL